MTDAPIGRPEPGEYAPYYGKYVDLVKGDARQALSRQIRNSLELLRSVSEDASRRRYQSGKWSLREMVGHVIDAERIFAYRALRFARGDATELPGFEQDDYAAAARSDERPWSDLLTELELVRRANILMFDSFDRDAWLRRGVASGNPITVRALAYIMAGHELHHMSVARERYLTGASTDETGSTSRPSS